MTAKGKQPGEIDTTIPELIKDAHNPFWINDAVSNAILNGRVDPLASTGVGKIAFSLDDLIDDIVQRVPQGPPGPAGETVYTHQPQGVRPSPSILFEIDGWEYSFATAGMARLVRDKLMEMTLEGEL